MAENNCATFWCDYVHTQFDPAHLLSELGFTIIFELVQLVLFVILWQRVIKPRWVKRFNRAHNAFDREHGIAHDDDNAALLRALRLWLETDPDELREMTREELAELRGEP